jgi:acetyl-CoA carboxylase/biotin carboxylase 1
VAVHFADLHDTPGRMKAKGVIRRQVQWAESRSFFYWRLRRRLFEFQAANTSGANMNQAGARKKAIQGLKDWYLQRGGDEETWEDDRAMVHWFDEHEREVKDFVTQLSCGAKVSEVGARLAEVARLAGAAAEPAAMLREAMQGLTAEQRAQLLSALH